MKEKVRYYSQHGEDFLLWKLFGSKRNGFYIDVGAFDGVHLSNSYSFEQLGWKGICIEANPEFFKICKSSRPNATCLNLACVGDDNIEKVDFYTEELGLLSGLKGNRAEDVRSRYETRGLEFKGFKKITTKASSLNKIIDEYAPTGQEIDFISIDVEGAELEVLKGLDLKRHRPRVILLEANNREAETQIDECLIDINGYHKSRKTGPNIFYTRDAADKDMLASIILDCRIEKNLHPLGEKYTAKGHITGKVIKEHGASVKHPSLLGNIIRKLKGKPN